MSRDLKSLTLADFVPQNWDDGPWLHNPDGTWTYTATSYGYASTDQVFSWDDGSAVVWRVTFEDTQYPYGQYWLRIMHPSNGSVVLWIRRFDGLSNEGAPLHGFLYDTFYYYEPDDVYGDPLARGLVDYPGLGATSEDGLMLRWRRDGDRARLEAYAPNIHEWVSLLDDGYDTTQSPRLGDFFDGDPRWYVYAYQLQWRQTWRQLEGSSSQAASSLWVADNTGAFINVGTPAAPLNVRMPDSSWRRFDGTSGQLRMRMTDGTWKLVVG